MTAARQSTMRARSGRSLRGWTRARPGVLLALAELVVDEGAQRRHGGLLVVTFRLDLDFAAQSGGQHHHAHDALGVDAAAVAAQEDLAAEVPGELAELGRCAGVQAELV